MTLLTDEDLESKNFRGKEVQILAKDMDSKRKFYIEAKKILAAILPYIHYCPG